MVHLRFTAERKHALQLDQEVLKSYSMPYTNYSLNASIGPGGIEMLLIIDETEALFKLQLDQEVLKYQL